MKHLFIIVFPLYSLLACGQNNIQNIFSETDSFLNKYITDGKVDYLALYANPSELHSILNLIENENLDGKSDGYKKAFWLNAYNLLVIKSVVQAPGITSPKNKHGFFSGEKHKAAGELLTLDEIERHKLLDLYKDERIHLTLVCGAAGCPTLAHFSYQPDSIEQQIFSQTKKVFNDKYFIRVNNSERIVELSKIFDWYKNDFTQSGLTILKYINQYRTEKIPEDFKVKYYEYDWNLNIR